MTVMNFKNFTMAALDLIGLELFRDEVNQASRERDILGTMSYRAFREKFPGAEVDLSGHPEQFLTSGAVLYHCDQNDHGGYTVNEDGREVTYSALYLQLDKDEDAPQYMTVGFTTLPGYGWDHEKNTINLLDASEDKVAQILAAHPEVPVYPEPVLPDKGHGIKPVSHFHRKLFRWFR